MAKRPDTLRIAIAQLNPTMGDFAGNLELAREARADAARGHADLVFFTELFISGYPPEDLVRKPAFLRDCMAAVEELAKETADGGPGVVIGSPYAEEGKVYNAVAVLDDGKVQTWRLKVDLPNYGEFDEKRVFDVGPMPGPVNFRGVRLGIPVCEDIWGEMGVCETLAESGAEILLVPNGSPYYRDKMDVRQQVVLKQIIETGLPMVYANQLGGQDELIFDGGSFVMNADKTLAVQMNQFEASVVTTTWRRDGDAWSCDTHALARLPDADEGDWRACVMGLRDYVNKNGFKNVVLGLSGGIDSAICAAMSVDALGEERVRPGDRVQPAQHPVATLPLGQRRHAELLQRAVDEVDVLLRDHRLQVHRGALGRHLHRHHDVDAVGLAVGVVVEPGEGLLELVGVVEADAAEHAEPSGARHRRGDVLGRGEGEDRVVDPELVADGGAHGSPLSSGRGWSARDRLAVGSW